MTTAALSSTSFLNIVSIMQSFPLKKNTDQLKGTIFDFISIFKSMVKFKFQLRQFPPLFANRNKIGTFIIAIKDKTSAFINSAEYMNLENSRKLLYKLVNDMSEKESTQTSIG